MSLLGGTCEPSDRKLIISQKTLFVAMYQTQIVLCNGKSLFGSKCVPFHRDLIVLSNTSPQVVHQTQMELGRCISLFGKRHKFAQSGVVITAFGGGKSLLEIRAPIHPHTAKKHGNQNGDGSDQGPHRKILT